MITETAQKPIKSGFGPETTAEEIVSGVDLRGKTVLVTGSRTGIGHETARVLSDAGAAVVQGTRELGLDLADPASIDEFAADFLRKHDQLDLLINNAGIMAIPLNRDDRGYELQFATNHLGHFQLTLRLWKALVKAKNARVVTLSSAGHRFAGVNLEDPNFNKRPYDKWAAYGQSKSANSLFSVELDRRGRTHNVRAFAVHPGRIVSTELARYLTDEDLRKAGVVRVNGALAFPGAKTISQGAATTAWCALSSRLEGMGGLYCEDCDVSEAVSDDAPLPPGVRRWAIDHAAAKALWDLSEKLTGVHL
jgi:NAD(P)-dependent dehydrogenase (short-subunit alcohol dehydrogenase family)